MSSARATSALVAAIGAALLGPVLAPSPARAQGLALEPVGTFDSPVHVSGAPGSADLFVVERPGRIEVVPADSTTSQTFLDISAIVLARPDEPDAGGEQGLLSIAFAPDYETSGLFYVCFTNNQGDVELDEFTRSTLNPLRADPASRRPLLEIPHREAKNHNGGQLQFGPDGKLYMSVGDGGAVTPRGKYAPDLESLLGKILRINPRARAGQPYTVPRSNPYVGVPGRDEILAYGLRNPWRFSFDGGRIAIADVGGSSWEETNFLALRDAFGANFGWPKYEGFLDTGGIPGADPVTFPVHAYSHAGGECAVTGGYVVRDPALARVYRRYAYADFCLGQLRSFAARLKADGTYEAFRDRAEGLEIPLVSSFGTDPAGHLYVAQLSGQVSRVVPAA